MKEIKEVRASTFEKIMCILRRPQRRNIFKLRLRECKAWIEILEHLDAPTSGAQIM